MKIDLAQALGVQYPIIGGAMTGVSDPNLTTAISEAGAFGVYASGLYINDLGAVREGIQECKRLTKKPFGVNITLVAPIIDRLIDLVCEEELAAITTGAGSPERFMPQLNEAGVHVIPVIAAPRHAVKMEAAGVTAVIAEGMESGGNAGNMCTMPLIPKIVDSVSVPVIAAGGIADGRGMAAAFALGACGVQMGTRFMMSTEAPIHPDATEYLLKQDGSKTLILGQRIGNKVNARAIRCEGVDKILAFEAKPDTALEDYQAFIKGKTGLAFKTGNLEDGYLTAGMNVGLIDEVKSCKQIVEDTMAEFKSVCSVLGQLS